MNKELLTKAASDRSLSSDWLVVVHLSSLCSTEAVTHDSLCNMSSPKCVQQRHTGCTIPTTSGEEAGLGERASYYSAKRHVVLLWQPLIHHSKRLLAAEIS